MTLSLYCVLQLLWTYEANCVENAIRQNVFLNRFVIAYIRLYFNQDLAACFWEKGVGSDSAKRKFD